MSTVNNPLLETDFEEVTNTATHGLGFAASVPAAAILVSTAWQQGDWLHFSGCAVYGLALVSVYAASTGSHMFRLPSLKNWFRAADQATIFLLIAATYTPFGLAYLRSSWWMGLLAVMWGVALYGFFSKAWFRHRVDGVSATIYLVLGWLPIVSVPALAHVVPVEGFYWMLAGGLCYTVGLIFWHIDRRMPCAHAIWHLLVIAGSACHYVGIMRYALPWQAA